MFRALTPWTGRKLRSRDLLRDWEPLAMMERFFEEPEAWNVGEAFAPPVDIAETKEGFEVTCELPGMKPTEVKVEMKEGRLYISGEKKEEHEEKGKTFHRVERVHGEFHRVVSLPPNVDEGKVTAMFTNGVLKVNVAKTEEAKSRNIPVSAA